jgi:hypothetical protein
MSWGAIGGAAASAVIGGMMSDGDGGTTVEAQQTHANPFTAGGGLFSTNFGPGVRPGSMSAQQNLQGDDLNDFLRLQALSQSRVTVDAPSRDRNRLNGKGDIIGTTRGTRSAFRGLRPGDLQGVSNDVLQALRSGGLINPNAGGGKGKFGLDMAIADPTLRAIQQGGLFGAEMFQNEALTSANAARAGELGLDFLNQLGATDPMDIAQNQFNLLNPILQQQQEDEFLAQEQRLFAQGRLGGAGRHSGSAQQQALFDAQLDAERKLMFDSLGQGLATQAHLAAMGGTLSQLDPAIRGAFMGLSQAGLQNSLAIENAMLQQAQVAGGLAGATNTGTLTQPGLSATNAIGAGLMNSGVQGLTNAIPGLFQNSQTTQTPGINSAGNVQQGSTTGFGPGGIFSGNGAL